MEEEEEREEEEEKKEEEEEEGSDTLGEPNRFTLTACNKHSS